MPQSPPQPPNPISTHLPCVLDHSRGHEHDHAHRPVRQGRRRRRERTRPTTGPNHAYEAPPSRGRARARQAAARPPPRGTDFSPPRRAAASRRLRRRRQRFALAEFGIWWGVCCWSAVAGARCPRYLCGEVCSRGAAFARPAGAAAMMWDALALLHPRVRVCGFVLAWARSVMTHESVAPCTIR